MIISDTFLPIVLEKIIAHNASPILVGGCVRDAFLHLEVKDYDIEVFGLDSLDELEDILEEFGDVNLVGKSFGILKLSTLDMEYDFSFPRLETKIEDGHRGFDVTVDGDLDFEIASKRRDFTINAIGYDYKNKTYLDPYDGIKHLKEKILQHIDDATFCEDALRVYRAVQFAARFEFTLDLQTLELCKKIVQTDEFRNLSKERIYEEYKKLFLKSSHPSIGLNLLGVLGIEYIDEETQKSIDEIVLKSSQPREKLVLIFSLLDEVFVKISDDKKLVKEILNLQQFKIPRIFQSKINKNDTFVERLIVKNHIRNNLPKPLYMGKDLIKMGYTPNEKFKTILDTLYKMQLNGEIC